MKEAIAGDPAVLRTLLDKSHDAIFLVDGEGEIIFANEGIKRIFGYDPLCRSRLDEWIELVFPDEENKKLFHGCWSEDREKRDSPRRIMEATRSDGKKIWLRLKIVPVEKGYYMVSMQDVTEMHMTEKKLRQSENQYRTMLDSMSDMIHVVDRNLVILYANSILLRKNITFGFPENIVGRNIFEIYPFLGEDVRKQYEMVILTGETVVTEEVNILNGIEIFTETRKIPIFESGKVARVVTVMRDITEKKMAELALQESETMFRHLAEKASDVIYRYRISPHLKVDYISPSCETVTGYSPQEFYENPSLAETIIHEEDRHLFKLFTMDKEMSGTPMIVRQIRKDGRIIWTEHKNSTVCDIHGTPFAIQGIFRDVTERVMAEYKLREAEREKSMILDALQEFIMYHDKNMDIVWANRSAVSSAGHTEVSIKGLKCYRLWHAADAPPAGCPVLRSFQSGRFEEAEVQALGGRVWHVRAYPVHDESGNTTGVVETVLDITDQAKVMRALSEEKERLSVTLRSIGEGVIAMDCDRRIVIINRVAEEIMGVTGQKLEGEPIDGYLELLDVSSRKRVHRPFQNLLENSGEDQILEEKYLRSRNGREILVEITAAPLRDNCKSTRGAVIVFRDITIRRRMEENLLKSQKLESLAVLAGGIAHDFNNILTAVLCNISLAKAQVEENMEVYEILEDAEKASLMARNLTQQLLTFSRGNTPVKKYIHLEKLIPESAKLALSGSRSSIQFECSTELWPVLADEGQINQVINNIVLNADQAMPQSGTVKIKCENVIIDKHSSMPLRKGRYVKVEISDNGIGIPAEYLGKIFDPYFTTKKKGSGLGLATTYSIIKKHDGYITVESEVGKGTTFTFYLPASEEKDRKNNIQFSPEKMGDRKKRILIMDDEEAVREAASKILKRLGYESECVADGEEVLVRYESAMKSGRPFDAVIMDLTVNGGTGGVETIKKLLRLDPGAKAIVSSGYSNDSIMAGYREYGFVEAVSKPYSLEEIARVLKNVFGSSENQSS